MSMQQTIRRELAVQTRIEPAREVERRVAFLCEYLRASGARGFVLGISGGQDSTLAGRLCQLAAERLRAEGTEATFLAVRLPYGVQADEADAQRALTFIRPDRRVTVNVKGAVDAAAGAAAAALAEAGAGGELRDFVRGNIKARERMVAQYALDLATAFNAWYNARDKQGKPATNVLASPEGLREARLALVARLRVAFEETLALIGIEIPAAM